MYAIRSYYGPNELDLLLDVHRIAFKREFDKPHYSHSLSRHCVQRPVDKQGNLLSLGHLQDSFLLLMAGIGPSQRSLFEQA